MRQLLSILFLLMMSTVFAQQTDEQLAGQYFGSGEYGKASELYEKLIRQNPSSMYFYDNLLKCYLTLEQFEDAEKLVKRQQKKFESNAFYKVDLGYVYRKQGLTDKANQWNESMFRWMKGNDVQTRELANAFQKRDEWDLAIRTYLQARKMNGGDPSLYAVPLAQLYGVKHATREVIEEYLNAANANPVMEEEIRDYLQIYLDRDEDYELLKAALLKRNKENPSNELYSAFMIWFYVQRKDFPNALIQIKAIDKRYKEEGRRIYELGMLALSNEYYDDAIICFDQVMQMGKEKRYFLAARMSALEARNKKIMKGRNFTQPDLIQLETAYKALLSEEGKNSFTASSMRELARLEVYYLNKQSEGIAMFNELIAMDRIEPRFRAETKLQLGDIYVLNDEIWEAILLYGQVDKEFLEDPLGQEAKFRNARLSYYIGEFDWARAQLDVLKTATSQLIANDALELSLLIQDNTRDSMEEPLLMFAKADLNFFQNRPDRALQILDSINLRYPNHSLADDILFKRAQIWASGKDFVKSIGYLEQLLKEYESGILGDNALFLLADITEKNLGDKEKARKLYEQFIEKYPGSFFLTEVRRRFRQLRGDNLN